MYNIYVCVCVCVCVCIIYIYNKVFTFSCSRAESIISQLLLPKVNVKDFFFFRLWICDLSNEIFKFTHFPESMLVVADRQFSRTY